MKKNTDFAGPERRVFIAKTAPKAPRIPRDMPPLFRPVRKSVPVTVALVFICAAGVALLVGLVL